MAAMTWWKFDVPKADGDIADYVNGFRVVLLHASRDGAEVFYELGRFSHDPETLECGWMRCIEAGSVKVEGQMLFLMWSSSVGPDVSIGMAVFGACYNAVVAIKGEAWNGRLVVAP